MSPTPPHSISRAHVSPWGRPGSQTPITSTLCPGALWVIRPSARVPPGPQRVFWCPLHRDPPRQSGGILSRGRGAPGVEPGPPQRPSPEFPGLGRGVKAPQLKRQASPPLMPPLRRQVPHPVTLNSRAGGGCRGQALCLARPSRLSGPPLEWGAPLLAVHRLSMGNLLSIFLSFLSVAALVLSPCLFSSPRASSSLFYMLL